MTTYCLTAGPLPQGTADRAVRMIENTAGAEPLALSMSDRGEQGWELAVHYDGATKAGRAAAMLRALAIPERFILIAPLPDIDWVRSSLEGLPPVTAGRFLVRGSHDRFIGQGRLTAIEIDAATAFGTGHHATTRGCLLALDRILKNTSPRHGLDIGCGSGILAIALARAVRRPVLAADGDAEAVRVTVDNSRRNGVGRLVHAVAACDAIHPAIAAAAPFDVIFANILARPLVTLAPHIGRLAAASGAVLLSGLYGDQDRWIEARYRLAGFRPLFRIPLEGWSTLVLSRASSPSSLRKAREQHHVR